MAYHAALYIQIDFPTKVLLWGLSVTLSSCYTQYLILFSLRYILRPRQCPVPKSSLAQLRLMHYS